MKNILLASLISLGFAMTANAETTTTETTIKTTEEHKTEPKKTAAPKAHTHKRMSKEERLQHNTKEAEDLVTSITDKAKSLTGAAKKSVDLCLAHAKLEMNAAQDDDLKSHAMAHINKAKRYLKNADRIISKSHKSETEKKEPAAEADKKEPEAAIKK